MSWHEWAQLLASNGCAVLLPNPRGSHGYGLKFVEANRNDFGGGDFHDIMSGVDYLIERGIADPERLGVGGWSYGGYMTAWAITHTDRFKAAVMGAGISNWMSMYGTTGITSYMRLFFDDQPFDRTKVYLHHSPLAHIDDVRTPVLILHGDADIRVPLLQSYEFYQGVRDMGVKAECVVYAREPHELGERAHQVDLLRRVLEWYELYLRP
jgi:dipeptidyl aminopeptidase/acylaminoacyl peptidase